MKWRLTQTWTSTYQRLEETTAAVVICFFPYLICLVVSNILKHRIWNDSPVVVFNLWHLVDSVHRLFCYLQVRGSMPTATTTPWGCCNAQQTPTTNSSSSATGFRWWGRQWESWGQRILEDKLLSWIWRFQRLRLDFRSSQCKFDVALHIYIYDPPWWFL